MKITYEIWYDDGLESGSMNPGYCARRTVEDLGVMLEQEDIPLYADSEDAAIQEAATYWGVSGAEIIMNEPGVM